MTFSSQKPLQKYIQIHGIYIDFEHQTSLKERKYLYISYLTKTQIFISDYF